MSFTSRGTLVCKSRKSFSGFSQTVDILKDLKHFSRSISIIRPIPINLYNINTLIRSIIYTHECSYFFLFHKVLSFFIKGTNRFEKSLNSRKYFLGHTFVFLSFVRSMFTCLIATLMLFVSLKTLVKREPLNTASLDAGYKSTFLNYKPEPHQCRSFRQCRKFHVEQHEK